MNVLSVLAAFACDSTKLPLVEDDIYVVSCAAAALAVVGQSTISVLAEIRESVTVVLVALAVSVTVERVLVLPFSKALIACASFMRCSSSCGHLTGTTG